jgi:NADPH:quinone reductase-like Zn-dependent oxidoreductase
MRAVVTMGHGGIDQLLYHDDWPVARPRPGEVLIEVRACGLNNTDVNTRVGWYSDGGWGAPIRFPRIQGADVCGVVAEAGEGAPPGLVGARVLVDPWLRDPNGAAYLGSERDGGYAGFTVVPASNVHPVDSSLSDVELATFATAYGTAENMLRRAAVGPGEHVLVTGASGGVGSALLQLARRRGATAIGIASAEKLEDVRAAGASAVIPRGTTDLAAALREATGRVTVDVVADVVGGDGFMSLLELLRPDGRYTCAGAIAGPIVELDLRTFYLNDLTLTGATVTPPGLFADLVSMIERGELRPLVAAVFPLERVAEAQEAFITKRHVGNIVLDLGQSRPYS